MALMEWDRSMSVGVEELDDQHKQLITLINEAYGAIQKHDEQAMAELIDKMREYALMHFATEEAIMREHGYPGVEAHKFQHVKFNQDVDGFKEKQFERTNLSQIFVYLSRWLTTHIMEEDMKYKAYMPESEASDKSC